MKVTITAHEHVLTTEGVPAFARYFWQQPFTNGDGQSVGAGSLDGAYAKQVAVTYSAGVATIAAFSGANQLDSSISAVTGNVLSNGTLALYDAKGRFLEIVYTNIKIPESISSMTWAALDALSRGWPSRTRPEYLDRDQITILLANLLLAGLRDVDTSAAVDGAVLYYLHSEWVARELLYTDLADVDSAMAPTDGQVPEWDSATSKWVAGNGLGSMGSWCVEVSNAANQGSVNHGVVHLPLTNYKEMFFEAFVKPTGTGYLYSSGYGGAHVLLFGFDGDSTNGYALTGNFFDTSIPANISFATLDKVRHNRWCHIALAYDGTQITCIINGIPSSVTAYTGNRQVSSAFDAVAFIGGSDHNKMSGRIAAWRLYEGATLPYANSHNTVQRPPVETFRRGKVLNGSTLVSPRVLADYTHRELLDISGNGYHGAMCESTRQGATLTGEGGFYSSNAGINRTPANEPQWVVDPFTWPTDAAPAQTAPGGAVIFDSFGRADVHRGNYTYGSTSSYAFNIGSTEVGGKVWSGTGWNILNGQLVPASTSPDDNIVTDSTINREIRLTKPNTSFPTGRGLTFWLYIAYTDTNNFNALVVDEYGQGWVYQKVAGVLTAIGGAAFAFGTNWTTMKTIVTGGNSCAVYKDAALITTKTMTGNLGATSKGMFANDPLVRIDSFTVI